MASASRRHANDGTVRWSRCARTARSVPTTSAASICTQYQSVERRFLSSTMSPSSASVSGDGSRRMNSCAGRMRGLGVMPAPVVALCAVGAGSCFGSWNKSQRNVSHEHESWLVNGIQPRVGYGSMNESRVGASRRGRHCARRLSRSSRSRCAMRPSSIRLICS
jgi:hypothetical protein